MLIDRIKADQLAARKARDAVATGLLTTLIGEATSVSEEEFETARAKAEAADSAEDRALRTDAVTGAVRPLAVTVPITDEKVAATVTKFLKNARANRELLLLSATKSLADIEREIEILSSYLPQPLSQTQLEAVIALFKRGNPDAGVGEVMSFLKANYAGLYDGKLASQLARG